MSLVRMKVTLALCGHADAGSDDGETQDDQQAAECEHFGVIRAGQGLALACGDSARLCCGMHRERHDILLWT